MQINPTPPAIKRHQLRRFDDVSVQDLFFADVLEDLGYDVSVNEISIEVVLASRKMAIEISGRVGMRVLSLALNAPTIIVAGVPVVAINPFQPDPTIGLSSVVISHAGVTRCCMHFMHGIFRCGPHDKRSKKHFILSNGMYGAFFDRPSSLLQVGVHAL